MQVRYNPFAEWVLIYYDPAMISEQKLLDLTKKEGCQNAEIIRDRAAQSGNSKLTLLNPVISPGDRLILKIESDGNDSLSITVPRGMKGPDKLPEKVKGVKMIHLQSSVDIGTGAKELSVSAGSETVKLKYHIVNEVR